MVNSLKYISPFMHTSLYRYSQFNSFDDLEQSGILKYCLTPELSEKIRNQTPPPFDALRHDEVVSPAKQLQTHSGSVTPSSPDATGRLTSRTSAFGSDPTPSIEMYKLDTDGIETQVQEITTPTIVQTNLEESPLPKNTRYFSRKPDTLFWSIFIAHYGVDEFTEIGSKYMNREMEEKMRVVEFIKKNRPRMKSMKITSATGEEMMGDLLTNQSTSMLVLPALALFYETRIWIVSEETNTYLEYLPCVYERDPIEIVPDTDDRIQERSGQTMFGRISNNIPENDVGVCRNIQERVGSVRDKGQTMFGRISDDLRPDEVGSPSKQLQTPSGSVTASSPNVSNIMIVYRATYNGRVSYTTETMDEPSNLIERIQQTMIRIENIEHPFKGISTYKLVDLEEIARKLNVHIPAGVQTDVVSTHFSVNNRKVEDQRGSIVKWKKNDWYVAISRHAQLGWLEPTRTRKPRGK